VIDDIDAHLEVEGVPGRKLRRLKRWQPEYLQKRILVSERHTLRDASPCHGRHRTDEQAQGNDRESNRFAARYSQFCSQYCPSLLFRAVTHNRIGSMTANKDIESGGGWHLCVAAGSGEHKPLRDAKLGY
jgi:hypothetical protein